VKRALAISWLFATLLGGSLVSPAQADKLYLVGGSVIEGKATRVGDKVIVAVAAGTLTLDARAVLRIEPGSTALDRLAVRRAALPREAVAERLLLADAYREEGLPSTERELLREVLVLQPDNEQARQRLGFVRTANGWVDAEQQLRAQGYTKRGQSWLSPAQSAELARAELERQKAELERQTAEAELKAKRAELASAQLHSQQQAELVPVTPWLIGYRARPYPPHPGGGVQPPAQPSPHASLPPFPINGVRDPRSYLAP
jgi:hypothetical protein